MIKCYQMLLGPGLSSMSPANIVKESIHILKQKDDIRLLWVKSILV